MKHKIELDGKSYNLNVDKAITLGVLEEVTTYKTGMRFTTLDGDEYILANVGEKKYCLISLKDGNRWSDAVSLTTDDSPRNISHQSFKRLCGSEPFKKVIDK